MKNNKVLYLFLILLSLFFSTSFVQAEGVEKEKAFSISPLNPETNEPQSSYYDLTVSPNEKKELKIRIFNSASEDMHVNVTANDGTTNDNGITSYLGNQKRDSSLKVAFSEITKVENNLISVPKNGSIDVGVTINVPEKAFEGVILGGIRVTSAENTQEKKEEETQVKNNIAYTVGVLLKENDLTIDPKMTLIGVKTEQRNYRNYISANLQNASPRVIKKLEATAEVTKKDESTILYRASNSDMRMAPNSNFNFGISLEDQPFKSGNYTMKVSGMADGKKFTFEKDFKIDSEEAKSWNENAVYVKDQPIDYTWVYMSVGLLVVICILVSSYFILRKKGEQKSNEKN